MVMKLITSWYGSVSVIIIIIILLLFIYHVVVSCESEKSPYGFFFPKVVKGFSKSKTTKD